MKKFTVTIKGKTIPVYVRDCSGYMQMRVGKGNTTEFVCGVDLISGYWLTSLGIFGSSLNEMVYNYLKYSKERPEYVYIVDDSNEFHSNTLLDIKSVLSYDTEYTNVSKIGE